ncbi:hypothetical protein C2E23DRAFT_736527, partial [Lenzites betulinus]
ILSMTADNASNNDTMTDHLAGLLPAFGGQFARTRCFLHILNLSAKSLIRPFDVKAVGDVEEAADEDVRELLAQVRELEEEERAQAENRESGEVRGNGDDELLADDDESWIDEVASLEGEELEDFEREVRPVKMVLTKVSTRCQREKPSGSHGLTDAQAGV